MINSIPAEFVMLMIPSSFTSISVLSFLFPSGMLTVVVDPGLPDDRLVHDECFTTPTISSNTGTFGIGNPVQERSSTIATT